MIQVPDARSIAAMHWVREVTGRDVGGSTGTNVAAGVDIMKEMREAGEQGSVVTLICDGGERYRGTYGDPDWLRTRGLDIEPHLGKLRSFLPLDCTPSTDPRDQVRRDRPRTVFARSSRIAWAPWMPTAVIQVRSRPRACRP